MIYMRYLSVVCLIFLLSCHTFKKKRSHSNADDVYISCWQHWKYENLTTDTNIKVLLFNKYARYHVNASPNQIIGILNSGDTVAILDIFYKYEIKENTIIHIKARHWTDAEKEIYRPYVTIFPKRKDNELICAVKVAYYGEIVTAP